MTLHVLQVTMVGTFPPPVHGMAAVNAAVRDRLLAVDARVRVINTAPFSLNRGMATRLGRVPRVMSGLARLAGTRHLRGAALYIGISGGGGQGYDLIFLLLARARGMRVFAHHHSFAYLDQPSRLTSWLTRAAGADALHVALSQRMAERLRERYPVVRETMAMSNAALLLGDRASSALDTARALATIGCIGNLSAEKGVFDFLDVCQATQNAGLPIRGCLAGPFQDAGTERAVRARLEVLPHVEYIGPVYGEAKQRFYAGIDVLLFPTRYRNEAEPLVVLEALGAGVPVIAFARGAIPEYVDENCGAVVPVGGDFAAAALAVLRRWHDDVDGLNAACVAARARFGEVRGRAMVALAQLQTRLVGEEAAAASLQHKVDG